MDERRLLGMDVHRLESMTLDEAWEFDRFVQAALAEVGVHGRNPRVIDPYPDGLGPLVGRTYPVDGWGKFLTAKRLVFEAMGIDYEEGPFREYREQLGSRWTVL